MGMNYTQAVGLLEKYGIKVSLQSNGLHVMKACAEVIQDLEGAVWQHISGPSPEKLFTGAAEKLEKQASILKTLRISSKNVKDGDIFWIRTKDDQDEESIRCLLEAIRKVTGKRIGVMLGRVDDRLRIINQKGKLRFMVQMFMQLTKEARVELLQKLVAEVDKL